MDRPSLLCTESARPLTDGLGLVRFRRIKTADVRRHLPDQFFVDALDRNFRVVRNRDFNVLWNRKSNRMRKAEAQVKDRSLHGSPETDSFDLQLLGETFTHSLHHIMHAAARESV